MKTILYIPSLILIFIVSGIMSFFILIGPSIFGLALGQSSRRHFGEKFFPWPLFFLLAAIAGTAILLSGYSHFPSAPPYLFPVLAAINAATIIISFFISRYRYARRVALAKQLREMKQNSETYA